MCHAAEESTHPAADRRRQEPDAEARNQHAEEHGLLQLDARLHPGAALRRGSAQGPRHRQTARETDEGAEHGLARILLQRQLCAQPGTGGKGGGRGLQEQRQPHTGTGADHHGPVPQRGGQPHARHTQFRPRNHHPQQGSQEVDRLEHLLRADHGLRHEGQRTPRHEELCRPAENEARLRGNAQQAEHPARGHQRHQRPGQRHLLLPVQPGLRAERQPCPRAPRLSCRTCC